MDSGHYFIMDKKTMDFYVFTEEKVKDFLIGHGIPIDREHLRRIDDDMRIYLLGQLQKLPDIQIFEDEFAMFFGKKISSGKVIALDKEKCLVKIIPQNMAADKPEMLFFKDAEAFSEQLESGLLRA